MAQYEKHPNGTWSVRFKAIENFEPVYKRIRGFKTKKEAENAYIEYQKQADEERNNKLSNGASKLIFKDLYEEFCKYKENRIKESSYVDMTSKFELHILPYFKNYPVVSISPRMILNWQNTLEKYKYKHKSVIRTYLIGILKYAERYYKIPNQMIYVEPFVKNEEQREMEVWEPEEFYTFINSITELKYKALFSALYFTGARRGEIVATTWEDWDLINKTLYITKTSTKKVKDKTQKFAITSTKNKTRRLISIPTCLVNLMIEYMNSLENHLPTQYVFGETRPLANSTLDNFYYKSIKNLPIKKIRLHDFRHSHASFLISNGVSIVAVSKRLGHKSIEETLKTYAHLMKSDEDLIKEKIEKFTL